MTLRARIRTQFPANVAVTSPLTLTKSGLSYTFGLNSNSLFSLSAPNLTFSGSASGTTTVQASAVASGTLTFPAATDTLVGRTTTDTLSNKTLVAPALGTPSSVTLTNATGLPLTGLATQAAFTLLGNNTSGSASPTAFTIDGLTLKGTPASTDEMMIWDVAGSAWKKATVSAVGTIGSVTSIAGNTGAFTLGTGLTNSTNDIRVSLTTLTNSLSGDVALNNTANYFDGPSIAQGTSGTWVVSGNVTLIDSSSTGVYNIKLWDGTTVIASARIVSSTGASNPVSISLSGIITSPAANIRISVKDTTSTSGLILFNNSGNSKDSTLSAYRIQ